MPGCKKKYAETCIKNFGYEHNFCGQAPSRIAMHERLFSDEGIVNVFQREDVKNKIRDTWFEKYGTRNLWDLNWYRLKCRSAIGSMTSIHKQVYDFIANEIGIECEIEFLLSKGDKYKFYDIKVGNLLIEVNGTFWHADPRKYVESDILKFPNGKFPTAKSIWDRDADKILFAEKNGYKVLTVWENDIISKWESVKEEITKGIKDGKDCKD